MEMEEQGDDNRAEPRLSKVDRKTAKKVEADDGMLKMESEINHLKQLAEMSKKAKDEVKSILYILF